MIRSTRVLAALFAALVLTMFTVPRAFAATPSPSQSPGSDLGQQISALQQQLQQQQATINSLADQQEAEHASVQALNAKVSADQQKEHTLNLQLDKVARIEYERPALTLITVMDAHNLGELLSGVSQARVISHQQQQLFNSAKALRTSDQQSQASAQAQLDKIASQQAQATTIAGKTQSELATLQAEQAEQQKEAAEKAAAAAAQQQAAAPAAPKPAAAKPAAAPKPAAPAAAPAITAAASITLKPGPSNPNRFYQGQCTWYVATIYSIPWLGNANQWPAAAAADGQAEGSTPVVGAIMESADSSFGHVSVVISVTDANDWTVREMNYAGGPGVIDTRQVKRATSNLVTFIY